MYTDKNFKTKKELKLAVQAWLDHIAKPVPLGASGEQVAETIYRAPRAVTYFQPGPFGGNEPQNGTFCCEGPHYPQPHRWYATCTAENGVIVKVK